MAKRPRTEKVPKTMQATFDAIVALTDEFSKAYLNEEYAQLARQLCAALCRKRLSPLARGDPKVWACGIIYALGFVNFLFDKTQDPHMSAGELCERFGVAQSTGSAKARLVRDTMHMYQLDPEWCLPSRLDDNLLAWMISVNGFVVDARHMPREIQEIAYEKGLIPYIPDPTRKKSRT
ncbi:MAG: DUF6398 domain-containing protein [Anaerolineae bacterium]